MKQEIVNGYKYDLKGDIIAISVIDRIPACNATVYGPRPYGQGGFRYLKEVSDIFYTISADKKNIFISSTGYKRQKAIYNRDTCRNGYSNCR